MNYIILINNTTTILAKTQTYMQAKIIINKQIKKDLNTNTYTIIKN